MRVARGWIAPGFLALIGAGQAVGAENGASPRAPGYLGIGMREGTGGQLEVVSVAPGSPASNAGLAVGDHIVRGQGGVPGSVEGFTLSVRTAGAGSSYVLRWTHQGRVVERTITLATPPRTGVVVGQPPPSLAAQVVSGSGPGDLAQLRGRVVVLDFWASWCGPCRAVMPALHAIHRRHAARGLTVLGVTDDPPATARTVARGIGVGYTIGVEATAAQRFGVTGLPTLMVLDRQGNVRRVSVGASSSELAAVEQLVVQLLGERP